MAASVIQIENLGKRYLLGQSQDGSSSYKTLRDTIAEMVQAPLRRLRGTTRAKPPQEFWAVRGASTSIHQGEVVGIIGRNGAGKSTLLKVLSRITEPTEGRINIRGRVASLLEVGTGFHPELTGRENIFLNGAILGMSRAEIKRKFDEIVAFSEIEKFLDTPVKRYSSGMYVRLAFAVAAHLEPEILIVDEVLAVGDANFQKKCLNKMQDVGEGGRTVLFVSHSMAAISRLCPRAILMGAGRIISDGPTQQVINSYLSSGLGTTAMREWTDAAKAPGNEVVQLRGVRIIDEDGNINEQMDIRRPIGIEIEFDVLKAGYVLVPNYVIHNDEGVYVCHPHDWAPDRRGKTREVGRYRRTGWIPGNLLAEGTFFVGAVVSSYNPTYMHFFEPEAVAFQVVDSQQGDSARGEYTGMLPGVVRPVLQWTDAPRPPENISLRHSVT